MLASPNLTGISRETSWPLDGFADLHLSGSEPRIFPRVVSRRQRRDAVRKGSRSEADDQAYAGHSKRNSKGKSLEGAVEEEESDSEMEEAGGMDE